MIAEVMLPFTGPVSLSLSIIDLKPDRKDIRRYVRTLENIMIQVLGHFHIVAGRLSGSRASGALTQTGKLGRLAHG